MYRFLFVDLTTEKTPANLRPGPALDAIQAALEEALGIFYSEYSAGPRMRCPTVRVAKSAEDRVGGEIAINLRDEIPEAPDALAYHSTTNGVPDIEVGCDLFANLVDDEGSLSCGVSHEVFELLGDPGANGWKDRQDGSNVSDAEEVCDIVQNTGFKVGDAFISNYLLPAFFVPGSEGPWDHLSVMSSQYDISHGYSIQAVSPQDVTQVVGNNMRMHGRRVVLTKGNLNAIQEKRKRTFTSRTYRRGIRLGAVAKVYAGA